jgi:hypothetical protein
MTQANYRHQLMMTGAAIVALLAVLWLITPQRWFGFYGPATALLAAVAPVSYLLWQRLPMIDWHRSWTFLFTIPALALAVTQIGFWTMFFTYGPTNPMLGLMRGMVQMFAAPYLPMAGLALLMLWVWLFYSTATERP